MESSKHVQGALEALPPEHPHAGDKPFVARLGLDEELLTLAEAARRLPRIDGKKIAIATIWRWCRRGLRGVFLEYVRVGRRVCTTREAMLRFFSELADLDEFVSPDTHSRPAVLKRRPITSRQRERALAAADAVLEKAGI